MKNLLTNNSARTTLVIFLLSLFITTYSFGQCILPGLKTPETVISTSVTPVPGKGVTYSVPVAVNATGYTWILPAGSTITAGLNTNVVTINFPCSTPGGNQSITEFATNVCGRGLTSNPFFYTIPVSNRVSVSPQSAVCTGSLTTTLTASGCVSYTWAPNTSINTTAGSVVKAAISALTFYTVTGTDVNGCTTSQIVPIATNTIGGIIAPASSIICSGGTQLLNVVGAAGQTYQWQISTDNVSWTNIAGAVNTTYATAFADGSALKYYRLLSLSTTCMNVASTTAIVDISKPIIIITESNLTANSITLNWVPIGSGSYRISYSGISSGIITACTSPKTITGLTANGNYNITITQMGLNACLSSGTLTGVTLACAAPASVTATATVMGSINVNWNGGAGNYRVYYRPLFSFSPFFTKDVTNATSTTLTTQGNNNIYASNTYEIYVSKLDCPTTGAVGQQSPAAYVTTLPVVTCATPVIDSIKSSCPVQIEVWIHHNPAVSNYDVYIQRLTPVLQSENSYGISSDYFTINTAAAGQQYLIAIDAKCSATNVSALYIYPGNITSKPLCNAPGNLVLSNPTCHGFTASWNSDQCQSNTAGGYSVYMRQQGAINWNSYNAPASISPVGPNEIVNWLAGGKTMQVFVKSVYSCSGFSTYGPSSQIVTITTQSAGCRDEEQADQPLASATQASTDNQEVFSLYPNPNNGQFTIDLSRLNTEEDAVRIEIFNMIGQTIETHLTTITDGHLNEFVNLPANATAGNYIVRLTAGKNVYTSKMNLQRN